MSSVGTWRAPLPFRVGGGGHKIISDIYAELLANYGTALSSASGSINDIETKATARALSIAHRAIDRRVAQADPMKLSTLLARWEAILGIVPMPGDTEWDRRRRVATRMEISRAAVQNSLSRIVELAFDPWTTRLHFTSNTDAWKHWTAGVGAEAPTTTTFWTSAVARFVVEYIRPATATDTEVATRRTACMEALQEYAPAWTTFDLSETPEGSDYGFYCDRPSLELTAFSE